MDSSSSSDSEDELEHLQLKTVFGKPLFTEGYMLAKKENVISENPEKKGTSTSSKQTNDNAIQEAGKKK